jgi:thiamine-phosphate pyrophosphorylase
MLALPAFYPIVSPDVIVSRGLDPIEVTEALLAAGAAWVQFRHKGPFTRPVYELASQVGRLVQAKGAQFVVNDRADVALMLGADGIHVGQEDLLPSEVRKIVGDRMFIGYSTHNEAQLRAGDREPVDYLALGPLFDTSSKQNPEPTVGVAESARIRAITTKPLVGIGGITRVNVREVFDAGVDSAAVISDFLADDWRSSIKDWIAVSV